MEAFLETHEGKLMKNNKILCFINNKAFSTYNKNTNNRQCFHGFLLQTIGSVIMGFYNGRLTSPKHIQLKQYFNLYCRWSDF